MTSRALAGLTNDAMRSGEPFSSLCSLSFKHWQFTIAKTWKQRECPSTDEWIKKMWYIYIYTMEYYSAIGKNEITPFAATWMILEVIRQIVLSQKAKDTYPIISLIGLS